MQVSITNPFRSLPPASIFVTDCPGGGGVKCLSLAQGYAQVDPPLTITRIEVKICRGTGTGTCGTPKMASFAISSPQNSPVTCYNWSAANVSLAAGVSCNMMGVENTVYASATLSDGSIISATPVCFNAVCSGGFVGTSMEIVSLALLPKILYVRFDTTSIPGSESKLFSIGMDESVAVKLKRRFGAPTLWTSRDRRVRFQYIGGASAQIDAAIELAPGVIITQRWICLSFSTTYGGVFSPFAVLDAAGDPYDAPVLFTNLLVESE